MNPLLSTPSRLQRGTTLIEVLVTLVILAFGLLGIAAFQSKAQIGTLEAYQRAQAVVLLEDMHERIKGNPGNAAAYVTTTALGTEDTPGDCTAKTGVARDRCEWSTALLGKSETKDGSNASVGAMIGARGCVSQVQAPDPTDGVCRAGIYLVTVAWQGLHDTKAPVHTCGKDKYGSEALRRAIATRVAIGVPNCRS